MNDCSYVVPEGVITMTEKQKKNLVRILIAAALTVLATQLPLTGAPRLAAFLVPYLVVGYDIL